MLICLVQAPLMKVCLIEEESMSSSKLMVSCLALAWVEYCNSTQDTYYANLRRKNGREKPYGVKYWLVVPRRLKSTT